MVLFTCTPWTYLVSKWGLGEVESGFVLISEMTQQPPEEPGLLLESQKSCLLRLYNKFYF